MAMYGMNLDDNEAAEVLSQQVPCHQPEEPEFYNHPRQDQEEENDSLVDSEGREWTRDKWLAHYDWMSDAAKHEECTKRGWRPPTRAAKKPAQYEPDEPDLADYFIGFNTPKQQQITICRAYASYLAAGMPKKPSQKKRAKKE